MKFRYKVMLYTMLLLAFCYVIGSCLLMMVSFQYSLDKERDAAVNGQRMVQNTILLTESTSQQEIGDMMDQLEGQNSMLWSGVRILNKASGELFYKKGTLPFETDDAQIQKMMDEQCYLIRFKQIGQEHFLQVSGLIQTDTGRLLLETSQNVTAIYNMRTLQVEIYRLILVVVLLMGSLASSIMAAKLTRPIQQLSAVSKKIADGNWSIRADIHSGDEIEMLAGDFNEMADKIEENIHQLAESVRRQEAFMGSFAHELKTPMTSIIGYADLLRGQGLSPQEQQESANYIFTEGRRLESLSLKLLDLLVLKKRDFELHEEELTQLIQDVIRTIRPGLEGKNIQLKGNCQKGKCLMEPDLVRSLVMNLVDNAAKAMDHGGHILITGKLTDTGCEIVVADDGRGMASEELSRITEAFYRVDKSRSRAQGGAGLGLALCSEIAALHEGQIRFESEPGQGTVVRVMLNGGKVQKNKRTVNGDTIDRSRVE